MPYAASLKLQGKVKKITITGNPLNYASLPANHATSSFLAAAYKNRARMVNYRSYGLQK